MSAIISGHGFLKFIQSAKWYHFYYPVGYSYHRSYFLDTLSPIAIFLPIAKACEADVAFSGSVFSGMQVGYVISSIRLGTLLTTI